MALEALFSTSGRSRPEHPQSKITMFLGYVGSFQVSHTWFAHYYVVSTSSSVFWALQIYTDGTAFEFLASLSDSRNAAMTVNQIFLAWLFMAVQGARRLYESIVFTKSSESKMWTGLWMIGIAFYVCIGVSVWIEGIGACSDLSLAWLLIFPASLKQTELQTASLELSKPSMKTFIAVPIFVLASGIQHDCHKYLASLKKYTVPQRFWFQWVLCPHYTCECLIYVAIAVIAAPKGQMLNKTILAGLGFVASNLAVTADSTRKWYIERFGAEKVAGRWRMVPHVY